MFSRIARLLRPLAAALLLVSGTLVSPGLIAATTLKLGSVVWIGYGPFYVADALDLYKKHGVKVVLQNFNDNALLPSAVATGSIDLATLTYDQVIGQVPQGLPLKVVMPIDYSNGGDAIVATKRINSVADFKSRKVAYNTLSPSDFLLAYALQSNKLTQKDIQQVVMTPEAVPAALTSGAVEIGVTYEPNVSQILAIDDGNKFHVVYSSKDAPGLITDVLVVTRDFARKRPNDVMAVMKGYLDGLDYMKKNPDAAAKLIGKAMGISEQEVKEQLAGVYNPPLVEMPKYFQKSKETTSLHASGAVIGELLKTNGQIKKAPAIEETYDDSLVKMLLNK
jgi:NitT/TauT family transport system substrate-binding protein